jgi:hypothetical protein
MFAPIKTLSLAGRYLSTIMLIFISTGLAQPSLKPNLNVAQFQDKNHKPYLEIYYSLPEAAAQYVSGNAGEYKCQLLLSLQIYQEQVLWASKVWKIEKHLLIRRNCARRSICRYLELSHRPAGHIA